MPVNKKLVLAALFIALGLVLPLAFHSFGMGGPLFLPMHIPVLLGGLLLGYRSGFFIGLLTPLLSGLLTGMPAPLPTMPLMMGELAVYGTVAGYFYQTRGLGIYPSLLLSLIAGRLMTMVLLFFLADALHIRLSPWAYVLAATLRGSLGLLIQVLLLPPAVGFLKKYLPH